MSLKKYLTEAELAAAQPVTGDEFDISIRDITNIETVVLEHTDGSVLIELDDAAIKMLEESGVILEDDEQLDEIWPALARIAAPIAKGAGKAGNAIVKSAGAAALKSAGRKIDKKLFGPADDDYDFEENMNGMRKLAGLKEADIPNDDEDEVEYMPKVGDVVQIVYETEHEGHFGEVVELSPSGDFVYVQFKDDDIEAYHASDLRQATEQEEEEYYYGSEDYDESINDIRRLSGMPAKETVKEEGYDKSHGGPYDRGSSDRYYGRKSRPHKVVPYTGPAAVKGQMQMVPLTDPAEIAAYNAGYSEEEDRKDWGESVNEAEYQGRDVTLGKPMQGDVKKFKVYVKDPSTGNVKKVNFGDPNMRIRKSNPGARKNFRARHNCKNPGPRTKARYWSCRKW